MELLKLLPDFKSTTSPPPSLLGIELHLPHREKSTHPLGFVTVGEFSSQKAGINMAKQQSLEPTQKGHISSTTGTFELDQIEDVRKLSTENRPERLDYTEGGGLKVKPFITRIPGHYSHTIISVDK